MNIQNNVTTEILNKHANLCKTLSHPNRLAIVELVSEEERSVGEIAESIGISTSTTSQHLRILKDNGLLGTRKEGQTVFYKLKYPKIFEACLIIRSVLLEDMKDKGKVAASADRDSVS